MYNCSLPSLLQPDPQSATLLGTALELFPGFDLPKFPLKKLLIDDTAPLPSDKWAEESQHNKQHIQASSLTNTASLFLLSSSPVPCLFWKMYCAPDGMVTAVQYS